MTKTIGVDVDGEEDQRSFGSGGGDNEKQFRRPYSLGPLSPLCVCPREVMTTTGRQKGLYFF